MENSWQVVIEKNQDGELFLPIGIDMAKKYGWSIGDEIDFEIKEDHVLLINVTRKARQNSQGFI